MLSKDVLMPSTKISVPQKLSGTTCNTGVHSTGILSADWCRKSTPVPPEVM